jgi:uncharacterized protein
MRIAALLLALAMVPGCKAPGAAGSEAAGNTATPAALLTVTIETAGGRQLFRVERAVTKEEQAQGLMYRTDLRPDGGMLFWPYPADGGGPREASFWMKNTPSSLDILFIRPDGTIARIADSTTPMSEVPITSGEPVNAVLELRGGRAAELGIAEGDRVSWPGRQ